MNRKQRRKFSRWLLRLGALMLAVYLTVNAVEILRRTMAGNGDLIARQVDQSEDHRASDRDKTGTNAVPGNDQGSQGVTVQHLASLDLNQAEGTRFELATGFPARHFQCRR